MPSAYINGIQMYYEIHGTGEPLIFANGVFANTLSWFNQKSVFAKNYQVILYDMRGQGQSDHPKGSYSFDLHADDQKALLETLDIQQVHHIGISYGAELGLVFALKFPNFLKSLTICCGITYFEPYLLHISHMWRSACILADPMLFYHATVPFNFSPNFINNNQQIFIDAVERYKVLDYPAFVRLLDAFLKLKITPPQLNSIGTPSCIIGGEKDLIKPPDPYSLLMHEHLPQSELHIIPEAGHVVIWEKPEDFNSLVLKFLDKVVNER